MIVFFQNEWAELQKTISSLDLNVSSQELFHVILSWMGKYHEFFVKEPFSRYLMDRFLNLNDEGNYPVKYSELNAEQFPHFRDIILQYKAIDKNGCENIARYLSSSLEKLILFESDKTCQNCELQGMQIYFDSDENKITYMCKQCGVAQYADGVKFIKGNKLIFATNSKLIEAGLIPP